MVAKWLNPEGKRLSGSPESPRLGFTQDFAACLDRAGPGSRVCGRLLHLMTAEKYDSGSFTPVDHAGCLLPLLVRAEPSRWGATSMLRMGVPVGNIH